jgi:hypothetical protein
VQLEQALTSGSAVALVQLCLLEITISSCSLGGSVLDLGQLRRSRSLSAMLEFEITFFASNEIGQLRAEARLVSKHYSGSYR